MVVMSTKKNTFLMPGKIEPLPHLDAVMDHIQDPFHGFCWDIGHNACYSPHIDMAKKYGQRLKCLHIHDNRGITRPGDLGGSHHAGGILPSRQQLPGYDHAPILSPGIPER
jgi:sugar phosphate isomerase/epimerase